MFTPYPRALRRRLPVKTKLTPFKTEDGKTFYFYDRQPRPPRRMRQYRKPFQPCFRLYFGGSYDYHTRTARAGAFILDASGEIAHEISETLDTKENLSCNVAEYAAVIMGLEWLIGKDLNKTEIEVFGDSDLVIFQMRRKRIVKNGPYSQLAGYCTGHLIPQFSKIRFLWIEKERNWRADSLAESETALLDLETQHTLKTKIKNFYYSPAVAKL